MPTPRVAPQDTVGAKDEPFAGAVLSQGLNRIVRTGRSEPTGRTQVGGKDYLINFDKADEGFAGNMP